MSRPDPWNNGMIKGKTPALWTFEMVVFLRKNAARMTFDELADQLGVSNRSIRSQCQKFGIKTKNAMDRMRSRTVNQVKRNIKQLDKITNHE